MTHEVIDDHFGPVKTKWSHPYNYDPIVTFHKRGRPQGWATHTVYTDQLRQWDDRKYDDLCKRHFGDHRDFWGNRAPEKIEAFLVEWTKISGLELVTVTEYCNPPNGYPVWRLDYRV